MRKRGSTHLSLKLQRTKEMKQIQNFTLSIFLLSILFNCSKSSSDTIPDPNDDTIDNSSEVGDQLPEIFMGLPYPSNKMSQQNLKKLFKNLDSSCKKATGSGLNSDYLCECPVNEFGNIDQIFSYDSNSCESLIDFKMFSNKKLSFKECREKGFVSILDSSLDGFLDCLNQPVKAFTVEQTSKGHFNANILKFQLDNSQDSKIAQELAEYLDQEFQKQEDTLSFMKLWPALQDWNKPKIYLGEFSDLKFLDKEDIKLNILSSYLYHPYDSPLAFHKFNKFFYEPEIKNLKFLLGGIKNIPKELYPSPYGSNEKLSWLDTAWRSQELRKFIPFWGIPLMGEGCESLCKVYGVPFLENEGKNLTILERVYSGGNIAMQNLWLFSEDMKVIGAISYGLNLKPMFYLDLEIKVEKDNLVNNITFYDRRFKKIKSRKEILVNKLIGKKSKSAAIDTIDDIEPGQGIILCENLQPDNQRWVFKGTNGFDPNTSKGSVYGWQKNEAANPLQSFFGVENNLLGPKFQNVGHGSNVSNVLLTNFGEGKITPAGYCFHKYDSLPLIANHPTFNRPLHLQKIKVLNASFMHERAGTAGCNQRIKEAFPKIEEKVLSVIGAGNNQLEHPDGCPQSFKGYSSIIVSGANNSDTKNPSIWKGGNYGVDFADIAADYHTLDNKSQGTSFSAPRVSGVAAKIAFENPYLKPQDIRLAILVTAHIPEQKLPVRSGGVLRGERALEMGKCLQEEETIGRKKGNMNPVNRDQVEKCLIQVEGFNPKKAKIQLDYLESRPLVFEK